MKSIIAGFLLASSAHCFGFGKLIDLSETTNLKDNNDDTQALIEAIAVAGEGGGVYIPFGDAIISSSVDISYSKFTLLGAGDFASQVLLRNGGSVNLASAKDGSYVIRDMKFIRESGAQSSVSVSFNAASDGSLTMADVAFSGVGVEQPIVKTSHVDHLKMTNVNMEGAGSSASAVGVEVSGDNQSASFNSMNWSKLGVGLRVLNSYAFLRIVGSKFDYSATSIETADSTLPMKWVIGDVYFENAIKRYIDIKSPVTFSIADTMFDTHASGAREDVLLRHREANGVFNSCVFSRGINAARVRKLGIIGNVFQGSFVAKRRRAPIISTFKNLIQMEGNLFMDKNVREIIQLRPWGRVLNDVLIEPVE